MNPFLFRAGKYLNHRLKARSRHGVHSPFVYRLVDEVIPKGKRFVNPSIESIFKVLKNDDEQLELIDFKTQSKQKIATSSIAQKAISTQKFRGVIKQLAEYLEAETVLEAGTSLGVSAAYLASATTVKTIHTIDGNKDVIEKAKTSFSEFKKINFHYGEVSRIFPELVKSIKPELIFLDADHRGSTLEFYLQSIQPIMNEVKAIIIHDIYWSSDMYKSWAHIYPDYPIAVDLFEAGVLFPNIVTTPQHFYLKF